MGKDKKAAGGQGTARPQAEERPPPVAFTVEVRRQVGESDLSEQKKAVLSKLIEGVEGGQVGEETWYHYSCPFPFLLDRSNGVRQRMADDFCRKLIDRARGVQLSPSDTPEERKALFEELFLAGQHLPLVAMYPSYASGDMYGFGAALTINSGMELIIVEDGPKSKRINRSGEVQRFMEEIGLSERVRIAAVERADCKNVNPEGARLTGSTGKHIQAINTILWKLFEDKGNRIFCVMDLFFATKYVALMFAQQPREYRARLREQWLELKSLSSPTGLKGKTGMESFIAKAIGPQEPLPRKANIVVLWSRFTGKTGGAHIEYDSSVQGMRQLIACAFASGAEYVFITGDTPKSSANSSREKQERRAAMYTALRDEVMQGETGTHTKQRSGAGLVLKRKQVVVLTEFWKRPEWDTWCEGSAKAKRIDQFKLWEVLQKNNQVKHFGARSGNLESLALLGYQVCYFEDHPDPDYAHEQEDVSYFTSTGSLHPEEALHRIQARRTPSPVFPQKDEPDALDKARMKPWHASVQYQRLQLSQVPTRSGKHLIQEGLAGKSVPWSYKTRVDRVTPQQVEELYHSHYQQNFDALPPDMASPAEMVKALGLKPENMKPEAVGKKFSAGFTSKDLIAIADYFTFR